MKITRGTWIATTDFINVCSEETGKVIACMDSEGSPDIDADESLANAYLMASAPSLLKALKMCVEYIEGRNDYKSDVLATAKYALSKSEGD
jgi:hypothetical protein